MLIDPKSGDPEVCVDKLKVSLKNCYGIRALDYEFDFGSGGPTRKTYVVYLGKRIP